MTDHTADNAYDLDQLHYYITPAHDCSYLTQQPARMIFVDPAAIIDQDLLSALSRAGFRRSGDFVYRPECQHCRQCLSCRVVVRDFVPNSSQKKALRRNQDLSVRFRPASAYQPEHYALYARYINARHYDGDMYPPSLEQFEKFLVHSCTQSQFMEFWAGDTLLAVSACDLLDDGLSAVYTFFDPDQSRRSLGVYAILQQIELARQRGLPYVYLGYWVPHSPKMNYKMQYQPLEVLLEGRWQRFDRPLSARDVQQLGDVLLKKPLF